MTDELTCAFRTHWLRRDTCEGKATSFFRTAKGTLWPLCNACCHRHKGIANSIVRNKKLDPEVVVGASFDLDIEDPELRALYDKQGDSTIHATFNKADTALFDLLTGKTRAGADG